MSDVFVDEFFAAPKAFIHGKPGDWEVLITLGPSQLDGEEVSPTLTIDFDWDVRRPSELAGKTFSYTQEEREERGVEGSVYVRGAHNPVDVQRVRFGAADDRSVKVSIDVHIDFDFEGVGLDNRDARIECELQFGTPPSGYRVIK